MSVGKRAVLLSMLLATGGCYVYQPVRPADAVMETRVRATVSPEVAAELEPALRSIRTQVVGNLAERNASSIMLDVPLFGATPGVSRAPVHNRVRIPLDGLVSMESRQFSRWRTGVTLGAVVAAVTAGFVILNEQGKNEDKGKVDTDNSILIRIPIGFR